MAEGKMNLSQISQLGWNALSANLVNSIFLFPQIDSLDQSPRHLLNLQITIQAKVLKIAWEQIY